jgi:hypothetical protein
MLKDNPYGGERVAGEPLNVPVRGRDGRTYWLTRAQWEKWIADDKPEPPPGRPGPED